jgi:hypothetical protein
MTGPGGNWFLGQRDSQGIEIYAISFLDLGKLIEF